MKKTFLLKQLFSIFILSFVLISCNRPICKNTNPIFDKYSIDSKEYMNELIKQINKTNKDELSYWFEEYIEKNDNEYIIVNIQNDSLCAKGIIHVNDWSKMSGIKRNKGKGYRGAKLVGLTFDIKQDSLSTELIYNGINKISD